MRYDTSSVKQARLITIVRPFRDNTMSIKAVSWAFEQQINDPRAYLVLLSLAESANDDKTPDVFECYPSVKVIADRASQSRRNVHRKLLVLCELGFIKLEPRTRDNGGTSTNTYTLNIDGIPLSEWAGGVTECHRGGDQGVIGGMPTVSHPSEPLPEPLLKLYGICARGECSKIHVDWQAPDSWLEEARAAGIGDPRDCAEGWRDYWAIERKDKNNNKKPLEKTPANWHRTWLNHIKRNKKNGNTDHDAVSRGLASGLAKLGPDYSGRPDVGGFREPSPGVLIDLKADVVEDDLI